MTLHIGIDISKASFDLCVLREREAALERHFSNDPEGFDELIGALGEFGELGELEVCLEPTSTYHLALCSALCLAGVGVRQVTLGRAYTRYIEGLGRAHKTDRIDAWKLAMLHAERREHLTNQWRPRRERLLELRGLTRRRVQLQELIRAEKNRIEAYSQPGAKCPQLVESCDRLVGELELELARIKGALKEYVREDEHIREQNELLRSIPQIGEVVAPVLVSELGAVGGFTNSRKAAAWAGLNLGAWESGTSVRGRRSISKKGNAQVRRALYQAALGSLKKDSEWYAYTQRKNQQNKQLIVAMMDKLLRVVVGVLKSGEEFDMSICDPA